MDVTTCRVCGCTVTPENGYQNGGGRDGLRTICRTCNSAQRRFKAEDAPIRKPKKSQMTEVAPRKRDTVNPLNEFAGEEINDYLLNSKTPGADYNYDYGLYEEALDKDPHLASVWMQRKSAVLSKHREIIPADDTEDAEFAAEFHKQVLQNISIGEGDSGFERDLSECLFAVPMGISISELVWGWSDLYIKSPQDLQRDRSARSAYVDSKMMQFDGLPYGEYLSIYRRVRMASEQVTAPNTTGKRYRAYIPQRLMSRHPRRFKFDADANLLLRVMGGNTMPLPDYKFLVFRPYARYENPYGDAGMRVVWWMTWFKRIVMNYWVRFTEVYVDPLAIAKPDKDRTLSEEERADMLDKFNHLQAQTGLIMPSGVDLIFREANRGSSVSAYRELIDFANAEISKAVIGQTLTTDPGHRGARSLGEVQQDVAAAYITQDAYALMALVNGTLLPWIHRFNIPNTPLPRMDINIDESVDKLIDAERYKILQELGLQLSVKDVMRKFNVKLAHSPEDILAPPPTPEIGRPKEPGASEK